MVRMACPNTFSEIPLEDKFGISWMAAADLLRKTRQAADCLGLTFHVGSQAMAPAAYGHALRTMSQHIVHAGVVADVIDVGGGFPSAYPGMEPPPLADYMDEIREAFEHTPTGVHCELWAEPGRALVAEAESVIVRVEARKEDTLYINDGAFGVLYDAAYMKFVFPARRLERDGEEARIAIRDALFALRTDLRQRRLHARPVLSAGSDARRRLYRNRQYRRLRPGDVVALQRLRPV